MAVSVLHKPAGCLSAGQQERLVELQAIADFG